MSSYSNDPRWILTRREGTCGKCNREYPRGTRAFYYPLGRKIYYGDCAENAWRAFSAAVADEDAAFAH